MCGKARNEYRPSLGSHPLRPGIARKPPLEQQGEAFLGTFFGLSKVTFFTAFFGLSKKAAERNRLADRGKAPCGGEGASTGIVVPSAARQVIGSDFSSPAR